MNDLYPELEDYIYQYCQKFQTKDELMAGKTVLYNLKTQSETMLSMMRRKGWISDDPVILDMIADGRDALKSRIVKRIWNEHQHELSLNLCPACNKITRSPNASQCRFCFHDWH
ncbi:hypothetical protein SAMN05518672_104386 [Chitinophaga sp. CF118]|uniref:hypothetical protein n=1 Tax=Chitinophaga sp. CF118 TaxID=1884367 RepID=UPI0008F44E65|nr:hypothetical protein [Chitinophaga sp. CF118]SFE07520.1 hypothetical protein SAMN05518672_104386 [Chitinophaga sp. CF118]